MIFADTYLNSASSTLKVQSRDLKNLYGGLGEESLKNPEKIGIVSQSWDPPSLGLPET